MFILTVRNDGLGDLILSLPTLAALHQAHPGARLGVVVRPDQAALFEMAPFDVEAWVDGPASFARLKQDRPDVMLFLRPDPSWARAAFFRRVPRRLGTRHRWQSLFFNERLPVRRRDSGLHEAECNARLGAPLGVTTPVPLIRLVVPQAAAQRAEALISKWAGRDRYVVVHPGSAGSSPNWPASRYGELVSQLSQSGRCVLVTCGPHEEELARTVAGSQGHMLSPVDLPTFAGVLARASVVVSGSTGPMHLAAALGTRVVALMSANAPHSKARWGPLGPNAVVFESVPVPGDDGTMQLSCSTDEVRHAVQQSIPVLGMAS